MSKKYRKKPVEVEAIQYDGTIQDVTDFVGIENTEMDEENRVYIKTLEGNMLVSHFDYVIKEPHPTDDRKFYPCKPDIFEQTYEAVDDETE